VPRDHSETLCPLTLAFAFIALRSFGVIRTRSIYVLNVPFRRGGGYNFVAMKSFALVLLAVFAQPLPLLPRQTVNKQAQKATPKTQIHNDSQPPSNPLPSAVVFNDCPNQYERPEAAQSQVDKHYPESTKKSEPWSRNDKLTAIYDGLTALLVFIALGTGLAVAWQAKETAKATQAMRTQVSMQVESLRPRLTVGFNENQFKPMTEGHAARMVARIINTGGTPAYSVVAESWIEFLPAPFTEFTQAAEYFKGEPFSVYPTQPIIYPVMRTTRLTDEEIKATFKATHCLCLRLRLSYESFGKPKFSDFTFGAEPGGVATMKSEAD
jgi:hypothetical protein